MRVGMVSTRFAGLDGVSLESQKVATVLRRLGHDVVWFAGEIGPEFSPSMEYPPAHFNHEGELSRQKEYFGTTKRRSTLMSDVRQEADAIAAELRRFVSEFDVHVLMPQNALAIPMQLPLAIAITDLAADGIPAVAHHHDMAWERERFSPTAMSEILDAYFPPRHPLVRHMVINSLTQAELARRRGLNSVVLPNVMDFRGEPEDMGDGMRFRRAAGLEPDRPLILQPTRVIPRKSIETTIELAQWLSDAVVIITHEEGDEGDRYGQYLRHVAQLSGVDVRHVPVGNSADDEGPSLADAYAAADVVSYPSRIEGFGNALLEAFYFRRPVLVRRYPVYVADVAPTGVDCLEFDDHLTQDVIDRVRHWIENPESWEGAVDRNFEAGREHFSLEKVEHVLSGVLASIGS